MEAKALIIIMNIKLNIKKIYKKNIKKNIKMKMMAIRKKKVKITKILTLILILVQKNLMLYTKNFEKRKT